MHKPQSIFILETKMARVLHYQLSNTKGLLKIIVFVGLEQKMVIHPTVHGEPLLTAQPLYYLEELESVATVRYEKIIDQQPDNELEYMIDNYLFEYSKIHHDSKITTKITDFKYWINDLSEFYFEYDQRNTQALVLDSLNDDSILAIQPLDENDDVGFYDWLIINNYLSSFFEEYIDKVKSLLDKKIFAVINPSEERHGYIGKLRIVKPGFGLIDYHQAMRLESIDMRDINPETRSIDIQPACEQTIQSLDVEVIKTSKKLNPVMLSYYFSGLREKNSLASFLGYYNVLEYYFEEAPRILGIQARTEREQLTCVMNLICNDNEFYTYINSLGLTDKNKIASHIVTSTNININGLNISSSQDAWSGLPTWLYDIRCAIVHSKKTRRQQVVACFEPYSTHVENIKHALPIIKWLACLCIDKDYELNMVPQV